MADDHECALVAGQPVFEPFDGGKVEMVGGLVEQQQIGLARQCATDRGAAPFAPACGFRLAVEIDAELVGNRAHGIFGRAFVAVRCEIHQPVERGDIGVLFEHHDIGARDDDTLALVGLNRTRNQLHQRRLARAVAPDQRQPVARADEQVDVLKQPPAALLQREAFEGEDGRLRHGDGRIGGRFAKGKGLDHNAVIGKA